MRNTELRIGNIVEYLIHDELAEPKTEWVENVVDLDDLKAIEKSKNYRPIPLTEEWLLNFGFYETTKEHYVSGLYTMNKPDGFYINKETMCYCDINYEGTTNDRIKIQYVHQLQNLYLALTGEELTYTQP